MKTVFGEAIRKAKATRNITPRFRAIYISFCKSQIHDLEQNPQSNITGKFLQKAEMVITIESPIEEKPNNPDEIASGSAEE
jgi:hypothetical protein